MTKHLCRPQFVFKTKKVQRKHLKKDIYGSWKLTFGLKMSSFLYLQLHFPGACKSLVHQNRKSHSCHSWSRQSVFTSKAQTLTVKAEVWLLSWDFQPRWSLFQRTRAFCRPQIWMHCMFWFLSMLTWSWTWTNEDLWELWSGSTHKWIFSLRHQQMLVVIAKYHDLEQANTKLFSEQFQPNGPAELQGGEPQWSLSIKLHCSKTNISWFLVSLKIFGNVGPYWRVHSDHTHKCFLENRSGKQKQKQTKSKEGQASMMQAAVF